MKKRVISLIIVIALAVSCLALFSAADIAAETEELGVITAELQAVMRGASATEKIPVSIWTTEIDTDIVEEVVLAKVGINRDIIREMVEAGRIAEISQEQVDEYIAAERRIYAQMQTQAHQTFVEDYAFLKTASTAENAYLCSYAPMICVELTKSQIQTLSLASEVDTMYYSPNVEMVNEMNVSLPTVSADYVRDEAFSGTGIKIGMVEPAVPNTNYASLQSSNIITDPTDITSLVSDFDTQEDYEIAVRHATVVAEIMVSTSSTNRGIVPDAELYCSATADKEGGFFEAVEDLLQQNVVVINMSAGFSSNPGQYTQYELWADHIAHNHSVHFVKSAGNRSNTNPYLYVTHPGLAYNVITVGAINDNNTSETSDDAIAAYSCFNESYDESDSNYIIPPNKPDVVAPGTLIKTSSFPESIFYTTATGVTYYTSGTSFAAPHVAGIVAQLIQQYPALATLQDLMKAMLTAAVDHPTLQFISNNQTSFEAYGAGVVNAEACTEISYRGTFASSSFSSTQSNTFKSYTFAVTEADTKIRVSLAWLRSVWFSSNSSHLETSEPETCADIANLDLVIIAPDGTELLLENAWANQDVNTNLVIIQFDPETYGTGTYTVNVWIREPAGKRTYFGVAWWANRE